MTSSGQAERRRCEVGGPPHPVHPEHLDKYLREPERYVPYQQVRASVRAAARAADAEAAARHGAAADGLRSLPLFSARGTALMLVDRSDNPVRVRN